MKAEIPSVEVEYKNDAFLITKHQYNLQFFPYYNARYKAMKSSLLKSAAETWPTTDIHELSDLADKKDDEDDENSEAGSQATQIDEEILKGKVVVVLGVIFKKMPHQPNILKELDNEKKMKGPIEPEQPNYVSSEDTIFLQAGNEQIQLKGSIQINELCTGICAAVKGHINPVGSGFLVEDIAFAWLPQIERPILTNDYYVAIVSGLGFSRNMSQNSTLTRSLNILYDIMAGNSSYVVNKKIVNLIIAGNCLGKAARAEEKEADVDRLKTPAWDKKIQPYTVEAVKLVDKFLANVGQFGRVDVMPGLLDPGNYLWPQQPMHPCLFPNAFRLESVRAVPNPHRASYFGVEFLGTSGQNVDAIRDCTSLPETTDIMSQIMDWGHIAPCCPDSLHCYPFSDKDPLVLDHYPDVFFVGNQPRYGVSSFESFSGKKVRLISVPTFEDQTIAVLVNLRTLNCEMVAFN